MIAFTSIKKEHLEKLKEWRNGQTDTLRQSKLLTDKDQKVWFKKIQHDEKQKLFGILDDGTFVGYCGLTNISHDHKRGEISFLVNTGILKDKKLYEKYFLVALGYLCNYGFLRLKLHKVFAETIAFRTYHIKILKKFGFKKEAMLQDQYFKTGKFYNSFIHSILWNGKVKK